MKQYQTYAVSRYSFIIISFICKDYNADIAIPKLVSYFYNFLWIPRTFFFARNLLNIRIYLNIWQCLTSQNFQLNYRKTNNIRIVSQTQIQIQTKTQTQSTHNHLQIMNNTCNLNILTWECQYCIQYQQFISHPLIPIC